MKVKFWKEKYIFFVDQIKIDGAFHGVIILYRDSYAEVCFSFILK